MIGALFLFLIGVGLSAFFSGSETGFYRVTRVRLTMDAMSGDLVARSLIWLTNNPSVFVATTLIGNNLANYLTSLAIVLGTTRLVPDQEEWAGIVAPMIFSPLVFVYGELLPKNLFFHAPNRLLRYGGPLFLVFGVLFLPISLLLWLLGRALQTVVGQAPEQMQVSLARQELQRVLDEGHQIGILRPAQRRLAHDMLSLANSPVERFGTPIGRMPSVKLGAQKRDAYRIARRQKTSTLLVTEATGRRIIGYVRILDLRMQPGDSIDTSRQLLEIPRTESPISTLMRMQSNQESVARIIDDQAQTIGVIDARLLLDSLLRQTDSQVL